MRFLPLIGLFLILGAVVVAGKATNPCYLPKVEGNCEALMHRFYYDAFDFKCKSFNYGGCGGNGNNFYMKEDCEKACKK